jgi:hypothetical protein
MKILQKELKKAATFYNLVTDTDFGNGKYQRKEKMCLLKHHYIPISIDGHGPKTDIRRLTAAEMRFLKSRGKTMR